MSEVTSIGCSVPDTDEQMNLIDYETNLENELRRKIQLLKQKYELIEATEPESYTKNWFDELKKVLPLSILSLIEKSDDLDYKIKNKKMHYLDLIKELKLFKKKQDETLLYLVKDVAKHEAELNE